METEIDYFFEGSKKVLQVLEYGGLLSEFLGRPNNTVCPLIGTKIKSVKLLGTGVDGYAYLVESDMSGPKLFVEKIQKIEVEVVKMKRNSSLFDEAQDLEVLYNIPLEITEWVNNYKTKEGKLLVPFYAMSCKTEEVIKTGEHYNLDIPVGSYICNTTVFPEFAIASLCGQLYSKGISAHFLEMYNFAMCKKEDKQVSSHTFMEKADGQVQTGVKCFFNLPETMRKYEKSLILQVITGIASYQYHYDISHNDLHLENVFYINVKQETAYRGTALYDADWYHYHILGTDLYLPATPYIPKIADFGRAAKWSQPIIAEHYLIDTMYDYWIPNWYIPQYDSIYFLNKAKDVGGSREAANILDIFNIDQKYFDIDKDYRPYFSDKKLNNILNLKQASAINILKNQDIVGEFMTKPKGKIVTLGEIRPPREVEKRLM